MDGIEVFGLGLLGIVVLLIGITVWEELENYYQRKWGWKKAFKGLRWNPHLKTWEKKE